MAARLTQEEFLQKIKTIHGDKYSILEPYVNSKTKLQVHCNQCNTNFLITPESLLMNHGCIKCNNESGHQQLKNTHEHYQQCIQQIHGDTVTILSPYKGTREKIQVQCNICGNIWETRADSLMKHGCPICGRKSAKETNKLTHEAFLQRLQEKCGNKFTPLEEYKGAQTKIKMKCNQCQYEYMVQPWSILNGSSCPNCAKLKNTHTMSNEKFLQKIAKIHGNKYSILEPYIKSTTKLLVHCNICGTEWKCAPKNLIAGKGCPTCGKAKSKTSRVLSTEEYLQQLQQIHGNKFTLLEEYKNSYTPIQIRCNDCGYEAKINPRTLIRGHSCSKCAQINAQKKAHEKNANQFKQTLYDKFNGTIDIVDSYVNSTTPITFHCNNCNYEWKTTPKTILLTKGCKNCYTNNNSMTNEEFQLQLKEKFDGNIVTTDVYTNMTTKMTFHCNRCGNEWETTWNSLKHCKASGCRICNDKLQRKTHEQFIQDLQQLYNDKLTVLSRYNTSMTPIQIQCNICNRIFETTPSILLSGKGCNCLSISKGEQYCEEFLIEHGCKYKTQYKLKDCKDKNSLPFDFAVFDDNNQLLCLIEFDGKQHLSVNNHYFVDKEQRQQAFEYTQKHDQIKTDYCLNNNISLIRIQYQSNFGKMGLQAKKLIYDFLEKELINQFPQCINLVNNISRNFSQIIVTNKYKTTEQFKEEIKELYGDKLTITGEYKNSYTKISCHCNICGNDWETAPTTLKQSKIGCPQCAKYKNSKTHEEFIQELAIINPNFEILEQYKNIRTPLLTKCKLCGKEEKMTPIDLLRGKKCNCMK